MTEIEALITAARRYLNEHFSYWANRYANERTGNDFPYTYTDNDNNLFPRYNVLSAILGQVEVLVDHPFTNVEACKQELINISQTANSVFTTGEQHSIAIHAMQEEREKFKSFIDKLTADELQVTEPLPYRRRLTEKEKEEVRGQLFRIWNFQGDYWNPLEELSPKPVLFIMDQFLTEQDYDHIISEIRKHVPGRLFEITEDGSDAEIDFSLFDLNGSEIFYCDRHFSWIVYCSHEGTVTFAGDWLIAFVRGLFKDRQDQLDRWD